MDTNLDDEFRPVDEILKSDHRTKGVDAFTLTYLRAERQVRKLFTHLVFQSEAFDLGNRRQLRQTLYQAPDVSFKKLADGIQRLSGVSVADMVGAEFDRLFNVLRVAKQYRDKLFHGQLPDQYLSTETFIELEANIRTWCRLLAAGAEREIGYDGFPDSHCKRHRPEIVKRVTGHLPNLGAYEDLLRRLR
ncbi:hypothetical protein [Mesorhizobium sp. M0589]|uniref:hypothetical protein n=1 Tax=Mesorhizobium sp. M0589 TaxID=2956965 RepID=UPI00333D5C19